MTVTAVVGGLVLLVISAVAQFFIELSEEALQKVVDEINNKPRKCLGWFSPAEFLCVALA